MAASTRVRDQYHRIISYYHNDIKIKRDPRNKSRYSIQKQPENEGEEIENKTEDDKIDVNYMQDVDPGFVGCKGNNIFYMYSISLSFIIENNTKVRCRIIENV